MEDETKGTLREFCISNYILDDNFEPETSVSPPECPVVVFVNSKSGGQLGGDLLQTYRSLLNEKQVTILVMFCLN